MDGEPAMKFYDFQDDFANQPARLTLRASGAQNPDASLGCELSYPILDSFKILDGSLCHKAIARNRYPYYNGAINTSLHDEKVTLA